MSDLTVLVSPIPLYPAPSSSPFSTLASRRNRSPSPVMVTLESAPTSEPESIARTARPPVDPGLLSPPINTWKAHHPPRPRHRPQRSQSAPPTQTTFDHSIRSGTPQPAASDDHNNFNVYRETQSFNSGYNVNARKPLRRSYTSMGYGNGYSYVAEGMTLRGGELVRPPPPLLRPTTFWRRAHRSGVASTTYSPAAHLVRRSTFIAAGLRFDAPVHDLSALGVESRLTGQEGISSFSPRVVEIPQAFELLNI